eukprot:5344590-Lingulodinium_polyedra.AAC.1
MRAPENCCARGVRARAISEPLRRRMIDSTAPARGVSKTAQNDAVESTVCRHSGSQIARARVPCERQKLVFAWSARACDL